MKHLPLQRRTLGLLAVIVPLLVLFIYVGLRSGPLAPVAVTLATVHPHAIKPALFGIGTTEARHTYKIGPTFAGRLKHLDVDVGDQVQAEQVLGEMDPVDLDDRLHAQESALRRTEAVLREAQARQAYAQSQAQRYEQLFAAHLSSEEALAIAQQELKIANAVLSAAHEDIIHAQSNHAGLMAQRNNLRLIAPVEGLVTVRNIEPGTTVVAGQTIVEIVDPLGLWINVRFDQISAAGLTAGLPAHITLRSRQGQVLQGHVLRVEPKADTVTEELLAKVIFDQQPKHLPPIGELAEVTLDMPALSTSPVIPNAAIQRKGDSVGVWQVIKGDLHFTTVKLGASDLDGRVQILEGLSNGDDVVVYSDKALTSRSRIDVIERAPGITE
ncbi:MAG: efflux RND transporter periplasmic adaptor subunit [Spongiibacteraceae bacterium]